MPDLRLPPQTAIVESDLLFQHHENFGRPSPLSARIRLFPASVPTRGSRYWILRFPIGSILPRRRFFHPPTMFLRSASRAARSSVARPSATPMARFIAPSQVQNKVQMRAASEHAIANPTIASIEKRWEVMPPQEQAELWMQLRDRMKVDWHEMTLQEKKAGM